MKIRVIAEGVETLQQADTLRDFGCVDMQGFFFSRPVPEDEMDRIVKKKEISLNIDRYRTADINMLELMSKNSVSSYVFNRCIGSAGIFVRQQNVVNLMLGNHFLWKEYGFKDETLMNPDTNYMEIVTDGERVMGEIFDKAVQNGDAEGRIQLNACGKWLHLSLHYMGDTASEQNFFFVAHDITEQVSKENELQEVQKQLSTEFGLMLVPVFRYEADSAAEQRFGFVSKPLLSMLGFATIEEFLAKYENNFINLVYHEDRERVLQEVAERSHNGGKAYCVYRIEKADGSLIRVIDFGHVVTDDAGKKWFYVVVEDIDKLQLGKLSQEFELLDDKTEA